MKDPIERQDAIDAFEDTTYTKNEIRRRITELPSAQQDCTDCEEYDHETHSCPKFCDVIRKTVEEVQPEIDEILNYLDTVLHPIISPEHWDVYCDLHDMISTLPTAQPERETGTWIIDSGYPQHCWCSNCNHRFDLFDPKSIHFCPNCGKKMKTCVWKSQDERRQE